MNTRFQKQVAIILSFAVSAALLVYLFSKVEWSALLRELGKVNLFYLLPLCVVMYLALWVRAIRWELLLHGEGQFSKIKLYHATVLGLLASNVLPLRAGEVLRPWLLSRFQPVKFSSALASIVTERMFDVFVLLAFLGLSLASVDNVDPTILLAARSLGTLTILIAMITLLAYLRPQLMVAFGEKMVMLLVYRRAPDVAKKLIFMGHEFVQGLRAISSFSEFLLVVFWSLVMWGLYVLMYQMALWSFGIFPGWEVGLTVMSIIAVAVAAPSAPGFVGTFQFGCVVALTMIYGYDEAFSLGYSLVIHAIQYFFMLGLGLWVLKKEGMKFREVTGQASQATAVSGDISKIP